MAVGDNMGQYCPNCGAFKESPNSKFCPECGENEGKTSRTRIKFDASDFTLLVTILIAITSLATWALCLHLGTPIRMDWVLEWAIADILFSFFIILGGKNSSNDEEKKN